MKRKLSLLAILLALFSVSSWADTFYLMQNDHTSKGASVATFVDGQATWTCESAGTYYFYVSKDPSAGANKNCDFLNAGQTFSNNTAVQLYQYGDSNYGHSITLNAVVTGDYVFTFADNKITCAFPAGAPEPASFTFENGSTWYFDFTAVSGGANWPTADGGADYDGSAGGKVKSTTFTQDVVRNLGEGWSSLKTNTGGWTNIALPEETPADGVNCIAIAADGKTASWSTYTPDPADIKIPFTFANGSTWYFDFTAVSGGANWPAADGGQLYDENAGGNVKSTTFTQDVTKNLGEAWTSLKTATGSWTSIELPADEPADGVNCIVIAADGLTATWSTYAPAPAAQITLYFVNKPEWETVKVHMWGGTATGTTWPGLDATKEADQIGGYDVYSITFDEGAYTTVIFNNGGNGAQTADLAIDKENPYCYDNTWYADAEAVADIISTPVPSITLYFVNKPEWETVKVHMYGGTATGTTWPGVATTKEADQIGGYDVYSITFDEGAYTKVIFNSGSGQQTSNLDVNKTTPYFYDGAWYADAEDVATEIASASVPTLETNVYLAGTFNGWSTTSHNFVRQNLGDEVAYTTITGVSTTGDIEFKVVEGGKWCNAETQNITFESTSVTFLSDDVSGSQVKMTPYAAGDYVVAFNLTTRVLTVTYPAGEKMEETHEIALAGTFNSWGAEHPAFTKNSLTSYTVTQHLEASADNYEFRVIVDGAWKGANYTIKRGYCSNVELGADQNFRLLADITGDYVFDYNPQTNRLTVTYPVQEFVVNLTADGYASFCWDKNWTVSGATVYIAKGREDDMILIEEVSGVIPAGAGVILKASGAQVTVTATEDPATSLADNILNGTTAEIDTPAGTIFALHYSSEVSATVFDQYLGAKIPANKAYLNLGAAAPARLRVVMAGNTTTGLLNGDASLNAVASKRLVGGQLIILRDGKMYNVQGVQL